MSTVVERLFINQGIKKNIFEMVDYDAFERENLVVDLFFF